MVNGTRQKAFHLKANQTVAATVEKVDQKKREIWVSAAGIDKLRPWTDLKVGMTAEGRVAFRSRAGVFVDIGFEKTGLVVAANYSKPFETLGRDQVVTATVEEVEGNTFKVSVAGVPKPRSFKELRVGETLEGTVGSRSERGVFVDVGCEKPALVIAPRQEAYSLERRQPVTATVERVLGDIFWVSVAGLSKLKFPEELQVGTIVNGTVVKKSKENGVLIDIGNAEMACVLAPRAQVYAKLDYKQNVSVKIEKTTKDGILVSIDPLGLKRLKLLEQLKEGDMVDGEYVMTRKNVVLFDIGCESLAALEGPRDEVFRLKKFEKLKGMRIDKVDVEARRISLSFAGLSDHVAGRKLPRRQGNAEVLRAPR
jgi:transcriptional accessory protein Tex/SPT6